MILILGKFETVESPSDMTAVESWGRRLRRSRSTRVVPGRACRTSRYRGRVAPSSSPCPAFPSLSPDLEFFSKGSTY